MWKKHTLLAILLILILTMSALLAAAGTGSSLKNWMRHNPFASLQSKHSGEILWRKN